MDSIFTTNYVEEWEAVTRLVLDSILGLLVGLEREFKKKPIGARGFILVCLGSALFTLVTMELAYIYDSLVGVAKIDPSRVISGIVGGIGFLGAGAIIQSGANVRGTGTGASIWCVGGIGVACGLGLYLYAVVAALIALVVLVVVGRLHTEVNGDDA